MKKIIVFITLLVTVCARPTFDQIAEVFLGLAEAATHPVYPLPPPPPPYDAQFYATQQQYPHRFSHEYYGDNYNKDIYSQSLPPRNIYNYQGYNQNGYAGGYRPQGSIIRQPYLNNCNPNDVYSCKYDQRQHLPSNLHSYPNY